MREFVCDLIVFLGIVGIVFAITCLFNLPGNSKWNDGVCPNCNVRYELRAVDSKQSVKYYSCPSCGEEVRRHYLFY